MTNTTTNEKNKNLRSKFLSLPTTHYPLPTNKGFSLVELIVVVGIVLMITSSVLYNHSHFSGAFTLESLAYEVALTVREAQFFGLNVREANIGVGTFDTGYGVYFDMASPTSFIFFADLNRNRFYDGVSELLDIYNITQGNSITNLCLDSACALSATELTISFSRPNPDAYIKTDNPAECGGVATNSGCGEGIIIVSSPKSSVIDKKITVTSTGQISVGN
ncbi:type II secretion system GspH family protein [Patescibacteria group bacterium]|nr:type II secretion system GspH family protein [Patescibacteria group bacterium]MCG2694599.1 type II secretion system GspH family protein [Candidatus Parcubacteria bacterium]